MITRPWWKARGPSFEAVVSDKGDYALATRIEYEEHDPVRGKAILQRHGDRVLVVNPPAVPLNRTGVSGNASRARLA